MKETSTLKIKCFFAAAALAMLVGCVDIPDSLKEKQTVPSAGGGSAALTVQSDEVLPKDDAFPKTENTAEKAAPLTESGNISRIRSQLSLDLLKTYKNIKILNARVGEGEVMPTYDIEIGGNPDFTLENTVKFLYSDRVDDVGNMKYRRYKKAGDIIDKDTEKYGAHSEPFYAEDEGVVYNKNVLLYDIDIFQPDKEKDESFSSFHYSTGNVWGSETGGQFTGYAKYWFESFPTAVTYNLDYEKPAEDVSYKMSDGKEWNLKDAITYIETFWNDYLAESDPDDFEYVVKSVKIKDFGDSTYGYCFTLQRKDKNGNWYDVDELPYTYFEDSIQGGKPYMVFNNNMTWCAEKEVITRYIKDFSFSLGNATDTGDDLLTLGKASDILSEALAPNINLELNAELNYIVMCKSYPYYSIWKYPEYYWDTALTTCDFEIKPFWTFRDAENTDTSFGTSEIYMVDAVGGDVMAIVRGQFEVLK